MKFSALEDCVSGRNEHKMQQEEICDDQLSISSL